MVMVLILDHFMVTVMVLILDHFMVTVMVKLKVIVNAMVVTIKLSLSSS
jgi:hypothetical protein